MPSRRISRANVERATYVSMCILATVQITWFYILKVPSYLDLGLYEAGQERMPFQARLLMMYPLRWAHRSLLLQSIAAYLTSRSFWFPSTVSAENLVELPIYFASVVVAGLVARALYLEHSSTKVLSAYVYPFFLGTVATSYCLLTTHNFRYVYDFPGMGLFACGLFLISRRSNLLLFGAIFLLATLNRETSIFLLILLLASAWFEAGPLEQRRSFRWKRIIAVSVLAAGWAAWRIVSARHFAALASEYAPRVHENLAYLASPFLRPQIVGIAAYTLPILLVFQSPSRNATVRMWLVVVLLWWVVMMYHGSMIEIRLFGELLPVLTCACVLLAEERITRTIQAATSTG